MQDRDISSRQEACVIYVMSLAVSLEHRRRGLASILLKHLQETTVKTPPFPDIVFLHVLATNRGAISFYKKHGFRHHKTLM